VAENNPDPIDQLADSLVRASWRLRRFERRELAPFGITFRQVRALRVVAAAARGVRMGDLAGVLEIVPRSATTMVESLERAGLVMRSMDPTDRRSVIVACTTDGATLVERLAADRRSGAENLFRPLSEEQRGALLQLLRSIIEEG
jgi:DNA-binding MarR family transcriptional regulator